MRGTNFRSNGYLLQVQEIKGPKTNGEIRVRVQKYVTKGNEVRMTDETFKEFAGIVT